MATSNNFSFFQGEDHVRPFIANPAQDITGWTIEFKIYEQYNGTVIFTKTIGSGIVIIDATSGQLTVTIYRADNISLSKAMYYYELRRSDTNHNTLLSYGDMRILKG